MNASLLLEYAMKRLAILLWLLVPASACSSNSAQLPTTPSVPAAATATLPSDVLSAITVGKEVTGTLEVHGAENVYVLTAPSDGTLVARLGWEPTQGRLQLDLADKPYVLTAVIE